MVGRGYQHLLQRKPLAHRGSLFVRFHVIKSKNITDWPQSLCDDEWNHQSKYFVGGHLTSPRLLSFVWQRSCCICVRLLEPRAGLKTGAAPRRNASTDGTHTASVSTTTLISIPLVEEQFCSASVVSDIELGTGCVCHEWHARLRLVVIDTCTNSPICRCERSRPERGSSVFQQGEYRERRSRSGLRECGGCSSTSSMHRPACV